MNEVKKFEKSNIQHPTNSWLLLLKTKTFEQFEECTDVENLDIEILRHPSTGEPAAFLFSSKNNLLQEILTYSDEKRSWFIDESVKSDGKIRLSTPIDPLFLVLPYLQKRCGDRAIPLNQLFQDEIYPATEKLLKLDGLKYLKLIADEMGNEDIIAFKYNEEKVLRWLKKKTIRLADLLKEKKSVVHNNTSTLDSSENIIYLQYAAGIVSDYLTYELSKKLTKYLNITCTVQPTAKRKSDANDYIQEAKKIKSDGDVEKKVNKSRSKSSNISPQKKIKLQTKASLKTKSIASYFKKSN